MSIIKDQIISLEEEIETCNQLEYELYCYYSRMVERYGVEDCSDLLDFFTPLMEWDDV